MSKNKYYVRILLSDRDLFEEHLDRNGMIGNILSTDMVNGKATSLYSIRMDEQQATNLKLSFTLLGILDYSKSLGTLKSRRPADPFDQ